MVPIYNHLIKRFQFIKLHTRTDTGARENKSWMENRLPTASIESSVDGFPLHPISMDLPANGKIVRQRVTANTLSRHYYGAVNCN